MAYIYRYIDLKKEEVVYIGKVTKSGEIWALETLARRHEQHSRENWYKEIGEDNIIMQYIELESHTDADIYETWLINYYGSTGQLVNKGKMGWGKSKLDMYPLIFGKWRNYSANLDDIESQLTLFAESLYRMTEGLRENVENGLKYFDERVRTLRINVEKADKMSRFDQQNEFLRMKA